MGLPGPLLGCLAAGLGCCLPASGAAQAAGGELSRQERLAAGSSGVCIVREGVQSARRRGSPCGRWVVKYAPRLCGF
jgi:hypothetical protein